VPSCHPTNSVKALKAKDNTNQQLNKRPKAFGEGCTE